MTILVAIQSYFEKLSQLSKLLRALATEIFKTKGNMNPSSTNPANI